MSARRNCPIIRAKRAAHLAAVLDRKPRQRRAPATADDMRPVIYWAGIPRHRRAIAPTDDAQPIAEPPQPVSRTEVAPTPALTCSVPGCSNVRRPRGKGKTGPVCRAHRGMSPAPVAA